jgi:hypothetical protein
VIRQPRRGWNGIASRPTSAPSSWVGAVQAWVELLDVDGQLVSFRSIFVFEADGAVLTSHSTLRFRSRDEVVASLAAAGYLVDEVRQARDRPGRELVFIARRAGVG